MEIIVKNKEKAREMGYKAFFGSVSKGSARPAFCNPGGIMRLQETVADMARNLEQGNVAPHQREQYKIALKKHEDRLTAINDEKTEAEKIYKADTEYWDKQVDQLEKEIKATTPSRKEIKDRMVNPHTILRTEQEGLKEKKLAYQIIQGVRGGDSNISYLQRK